MDYKPIRGVNIIESYKTISSEILKKLEDKLTLAEKTGDSTALEELLSDDFTGINLLGQVIDKNTFITNHCNSCLKFNKLEISELQYKITDTVGVVAGKAFYHAIVNGQPAEGCTRFLDVWVNCNDRIMLISSAVIRNLSI